MKAKYPLLYEWTLVLLVAGWMVFPNLTGLFCILFLGVVVLGVFLKELVFRPPGIFWGMWLFFPCYLLYSFNTSNTGDALFGLEKKLSFIIFPLIFAFIPRFKVRITRIENGFLLALFAILGICYGNALIAYQENQHDAAFWYSSHFSGLFHHPTYLSMYCAAGVYLLFTRLQQPSTLNLRLMFALGMGCLIYTHWHLESLSGLLFLILLCAVLFSMHLLKTKGWKVLLLFGGIGTLCLVLFVLSVPSLQRNLSDSVGFVRNYWKDPYTYTHTPRGEIRGNDVRLILWTASAEILREHPNGVGVGNLPAAMEAKLHEYGQVNLAKEGLNPHNQYLHTAVETGWIGMLWMIGLLVALVVYGWRNKAYLLVLVSCCFAFNGLFESVLERQSGIVFWLLWSCLLLAFTQALKFQQHEA